MNRHWVTIVVMLLAGWLGAARVTCAAYVQVQLPIEKLPEEHEFQKQLRAYMATLRAEDFVVERKDFTVVDPKDDEARYRMWLLSIYMPTFDALQAPAEGFTLKSIESMKGLRLPAPVQNCQSLAWLSAWDYPGNPYHGSRAVKLRAFVVAAIDTIMLDHLYDNDPRGADRADYLGGNLIWLGVTYAGVKDVLPAEARKAFEAGLKKHIQRINGWGPKGSMTDMDLFAPVGLWYLQKAMNDPEVSKLAQNYSRQLFTNQRYFNAAGYFVDNNCFDTSYNGISLYFGAWAALATDWKFTHEAIQKAFRLRAHLCFPDPVGGSFAGPAHMSSRTSGDPHRDQWNFPYRAPGTAMASDDAIYLAPFPDAAALSAATTKVVDALNLQLAKPRGEEKNTPWAEAHWSNQINFGYDHYQPGYFARRQKLEQEKSPLLLPLYRRPGNFVHQFDKAFTIAKLGGYATAIHTGPVGRAVGHGGRMYGFGGGQLSTFWTPDSGVVIVGRRRGVQGAVFETYEEWREWPNNAVIGLTTKNELAHSARIITPETSADVSDNKATVTASGNMPMYNEQRSATTPSGCHYERTFTLDGKGVQVLTKVVSDGKELFSELYETIPVMIRETSDQPATSIQFQIAGNWSPAKPGKSASVQAVKLTRFNGSAVITFDKPRTIHMSEKPWKDGFQTQVEVQNLRIDLLEGQSAGGKIGTVTSGYTIAPAAATP